jgi:hypothetical protein
LLIGTDKEEYHKGEVVDIVIRPNKNIRVEKIRISIPSQAELEANCSFVAREHRCGTGVRETILTPDSTGTFRYQWIVPTTAGLVTTPSGEITYVIVVGAAFGTFTKPIPVTEKPIEVPTTEITGRIIDKVNRLTESFVPITIEEKIIAGKIFLPKSVQGSLFTPTRDEEPNVNLQVNAEDGTCIIGQETGCLISESTRVAGSIYKTITLNGADYQVRYSGPDVKLEKFTITPVTEGGLIGTTFNVQVIKDTQPSRLYYKVSYDPSD